MKFEVGKIYKLFWKKGDMMVVKAVCKCMEVDDPKIPGLRPVKLSVSKFFDDLNLYWFADLEEYAEESTPKELEKYATTKEHEFKLAMRYEDRFNRTTKEYEQLTLW